MTHGDDCHFSTPSANSGGVGKVLQKNLNEIKNMAPIRSRAIGISEEEKRISDGSRLSFRRLSGGGNG